MNELPQTDCQVNESKTPKYKYAETTKCGGHFRLKAMENNLLIKTDSRCLCGCFIRAHPLVLHYHVGSCGYHIEKQMK